MVLRKLSQTLKFFLAVMITVFSSGLMPSAVAYATPGQNNRVPVTICHRTNSVTNPYVQITVDQDSVDNDLGNDNGQGDHYAEHTGAVFDPNTIYPTPHNGDQWGDIIPPIAGIHGGLNWTTAGQAIYTNGCNVPTATKVTVTAPYATDPTCEADGMLVIPTTAHVTWTGGANGDGPGTYNLVATADQGYEIEGQSEWTIEVLSQLTGEQCEELIPVTPETPTVSPLCGPNNDTVTLPTQTGVTYSSTGWINGSLTVTAAAQPGYTLQGQTSWTFTDSNVACPDEDELDLDFDIDDKCIKDDEITGKITFTVENDGDTAVDNLMVHLYDANGLLVDVEAINVAADDEAETTFSSLAKGNYTVKVFDSTEEVILFTDEVEVDECGGGSLPTDVCPNITGPQFIIPAGLVKDDNGDCVTDQCPLVPGIQTNTTLCPPGQGGEEPEEPETPTTPTTPTNPGQGGQTQGTSTTKTPTTPQTLSTSTTLPATLPATGGSSNPLLIVLASILAYGVAYFVQGRRQLAQDHA